jgi:hypothetical protein
MGIAGDKPRQAPSKEGSDRPNANQAAHKKVRPLVQDSPTREKMPKYSSVFLANMT